MPEEQQASPGFEIVSGVALITLGLTLSSVILGACFAVGVTTYEITMNWLR